MRTAGGRHFVSQSHPRVSVAANQPDLASSPHKWTLGLPGKGVRKGTSFRPPEQGTCPACNEVWFRHGEHRKQTRFCPKCWRRGIDSLAAYREPRVTQGFRQRNRVVMGLTAQNLHLKDIALGSGLDDSTVYQTLGQSQEVGLLRGGCDHRALPRHNAKHISDLAAMQPTLTTAAAAPADWRESFSRRRC